MTHTFANGKTITHQGDGEQFIAMAPDVCKTPSPGGPVPIPYPNIALSSDLASGSRTVTVEGHPAALKSSNLSTSSGDEGGTAGGGVVSGKIKGKLTWVMYSLDVKIEGQGVVRFLDSNLHNGNGSNTGGKNKGRMTWPGVGGSIVCDNCGKPFDDPSHVQLRASSDSDRHAQNTDGRTTAAVVVECAKGKASVTTGAAGKTLPAPILNPNSFAALAKNFKSKKPIEPASLTDQNPAGNCAEQRALYDAFANGSLPLKDGCHISMSVMRAVRGKTAKQHVLSCDTCKRVVTSMLCTNDPQPR